ncbi:MAG TPA: sulfur carrier protein ThiS [Prosthecobacter sp.]|nr:sulfur carrier protein ThiS [Prosthecobacter sp.]
MRITLNGEVREFDAPLTVGVLLRELNLTGKPVVVEHNQTALLPREIEGAALAEGDVVEVVQITAGG